jgi:cold shock CspA family protein
MKYEGTVSVWINSRNFGFIVDAQYQRLFLHRSKILSGKPFVGAKVLYDIAPEREGANFSAVNVEVLASNDGGAR